MAKEKVGDSKPKEQNKVSSKKTVTVQFKQYRKFDLHVGRDMVTFLGKESKSIPADWLKHPDFKQVQKYFVVKGV